ncbi:MAG: glycosyl hydrolase [Mangrovibacterium sp.]
MQYGLQQQKHSVLELEIGLHNTAGYATTGGPWIDEKRSMQKLIWSITKTDGGKKVSMVITEPERSYYHGWGSTGQKAVSWHDIALLAVPDKTTVSIEDVIDLSSKMDATGKLVWEAPSGKWNLYRIGYSPTGVNPHPPTRGFIR